MPNTPVMYTTAEGGQYIPAIIPLSPREIAQQCVMNLIGGKSPMTQIVYEKKITLLTGSTVDYIKIKVFAIMIPANDGTRVHWFDSVLATDSELPGMFDCSSYMGNPEGKNLDDIWPEGEKSVWD